MKPLLRFNEKVGERNQIQVIKDKRRCTYIIRKLAAPLGLERTVTECNYIKKRSNLKSQALAAKPQSEVPFARMQIADYIC